MIAHKYTAPIWVMGVLAALAMVVMPAWAGGIGYQGQDDSWYEQSRLLSPEGGKAGYRFGISIAVDGDYALVGSPGPSGGAGYLPGEAYIFARENGVWQKQAKLTPSDSESGDFFGINVALSEDVAMVFAGTLGSGSTSEGKVYVFARDGEDWSEQQILTGSGGGPSDLFGLSISIDGDFALIGAGNETVNGIPTQGAAYVFRRSDGIWEEEARLLADDEEMSWFFGASLALEGDSALVGAPHAAVNGVVGTGAVYAFTYEGGAWSQQAKLVAPDGSIALEFGYVALQGNLALIGAGRGGAFLFERSGDNWGQALELPPTLGVASSQYGYSVDLLGDIAVVGDPGASVDDVETGAVHVFRADGGVWSQEALLTASDGADGHQFGASVAISDSGLFVGAPRVSAYNVTRQGAAYFFDDLDPSPDSATLEGALQSLGHCDSEVLLLENATIEVAGVSGSYSAVSRYDGYYRLYVSAGESPIDITVTAPGHLPITIAGVSFGSGDTLTEDFDLTLEQACAEAAPEGLAVELDPGQNTVETLTIDNTGGGAPLAWSMESSSPMQRPAVHGAIGCELAPGVIVHDNGTIGAQRRLQPSRTAYVDRFMPQAYPSMLNEVCVALAGLYEGAVFDFEIVIFDDDGEDGGPGTELGVLPVSMNDLPLWPITKPVWAGFDVSSLNVVIDEGAVYIGMRWLPDDHDAVLPLDLFPDNRPVGYAGGFFWHTPSDGWIPTQLSSGPESHYRSLLIRAATDPRGCLAPSEVTWLSVDQDSGITSAGTSATVQVTLDGSDLDPGVYSASLCISTDDPLRPLLVVPVELGVTGPPGPGVLAADPGIVDFGEVSTGSSQIDSFVATNATAPGADDIEIASIELSTGAPEFQLAGGSCEAGAVLSPGGMCRVRVRLQPGNVSDTVFDGTVTVATTDGQALVVSLAGEVPPKPPAIVVDPGSFSSVLPQGQSESQSLTVMNLGDAVLDWTVTEDGTLGGRVLRPATTVTLPKTRKGSRALDQWSVPDRPAVATSHPFHTRSGQVTLTHSESMDIEGPAASCRNASDGTTLANSYLRTFTLPDFGIDGPLEVSEVTFGIGELTAVVPLTLNLYTLDGDFIYDNMTLIESVSEGMDVVNIQDPILVTFPVDARIPPGATLVVEVAVPDLTGVGGFYPAANSLGESAPSYIVAPRCGNQDPTPYSSIGLPNTHLVMSVTGTAEPLNCALPDWIQASAMGGTVPGGEEQAVELTFNSSDTSPGPHHGTLCLNSNDPGRLRVTIPLGLVVEEGQAGPGELVAQPAELDFGAVEMGASTTASVTVIHTAEAAAEAILIGTVELLSGAPAFELIGDNCQGTGLAPGESCSLEVRFEPSAEQLYTGVVRVRGDDSQELVVGLSGTGAIPDGSIFSDRFE